MSNSEPTASQQRPLRCAWALRLQPQSLFSASLLLPSFLASFLLAEVIFGNTVCFKIVKEIIKNKKFYFKIRVMAFFFPPDKQAITDLPS